MAKLTKSNSFSSMLAIVIAVVALFAGVYAVVKINANPNSSAGTSTSDAKCRYVCKNGEVCRKDCVKVLNTNVTCESLGGTDISRINKCLNAVAEIPSSQCSNWCLTLKHDPTDLSIRATETAARLGGMEACINSCAEIEAGSKTCDSVCSVIPNTTPNLKKARQTCLSECSKIVPD